MHGREKNFFFGPIFDMDILMDLHLLKSPKSENHIFNGWSVCVRVCYHLNSKTNYSRNFKFDIVHLYHTWMRLETLHEDRTKTLFTGYGLCMKFSVRFF